MSMGIENPLLLMLLSFFGGSYKLCVKLCFSVLFSFSEAIIKMARKHNIKESYPDTQGKDEYSGVQIIVYVRVVFKITWVTLSEPRN